MIVYILIIALWLYISLGNFVSLNKTSKLRSNLAYLIAGLICLAEAVILIVLLITSKVTFDMGFWMNNFVYALIPVAIYGIPGIIVINIVFATLPIGTNDYIPLESTPNPKSSTSKVKKNGGAWFTFNLARKRNEPKSVDDGTNYL